MYSQHVRKKLFNEFPVVLNSNNHAICPMCEGVFSTKVTLEHIIPKGGEGDCCFAILPINLVKCCGECNTNLHSKKSDCAENSELNPYFESFEISQYLNIGFVKDEKGYYPIVNFNFGATTQQKRYEYFVKNYNLEKTYTHRVNLEYQKLKNVLSNSPIISSKRILISFLEREKNVYEENRNIEKFSNQFWLDQNYFGYMICEYLLNTEEAIQEFNTEIQKLRTSVSCLSFENQDFMKEFEGVSDLHSFQKLITENLNDIMLYSNHVLKTSDNIKLPQCVEWGDDIKKLKVIESIFKYNILKKRDFSTFEETCRKVIE